MKYPKRVTVIELENAPFRCAKDAEAYAIGHGIVGVMSNVDTGGKGIEVLKGNCRTSVRPNNRTSMDVSILLNGVCDVNGEPLLK